MASLPDFNSTQDLPLAALHELLETSYQLLLPKVSCCSITFLHQILTGRKLSIPLFHARHFCLLDSPSTKVKFLSSYCEKNRELRRYVPDGGCQDRDFLVQVMATKALDRLVELHKEALLGRFNIKAETEVMKPAFSLADIEEHEIVIAAAIPE